MSNPSALFTTLYSASAIAGRVSDLANEIQRDFAGHNVVHAIVTLNGSFMFAADLCRQLNLPLEMHFAGEANYHGNKKGTMALNADSLPPSFKNNPVLVIEDVMDSGNTLGALKNLITGRDASLVKVVSLLKRQGASAQVDYFGFTLPQGLFVVGYGLDLNGRYRELPDLRTLGAGMHAGSGGMC